MGYTKKWIPPTIPLRNDLAAWKMLFQDVHDNLLLSGLVQTDTAGQLVIADVVSLPADATYSGFIEYAFDDDLQDEAPIVIRLEFGCDAEGLNTGSTSNCRSRTPRIRATVYFNGIAGVPFGCPQTNSAATGSVTTQLIRAGTSYICHNQDIGFLGVVYGAGSRNNPMANSSGGYIGATLSLFIQRSVDPDGSPTPDGISIYSPGFDVPSSSSTLWTAGVVPAAYSRYMTGSAGQTSSRRDMALRLAGVSGGVISGEVQFQRVHVETPHIRDWPTLFSYVQNVVPEGTEFELDVFPGAPQNFIALGRETSIGVDPIVGQNAGLAMLFE